jgi:hypothetical protein
VQALKRLAIKILKMTGLIGPAMRLRDKMRRPTIYSQDSFLGKHSPIVHSNWQVVPELQTATLNVVLPSLESRHMSGGPNTAINLAVRITNLGIPVRFFTINVPLQNSREALLAHCEKISEGDLHPALLSFHDASAGSHPLIGPNDYFLATAWWTVQSIKDVVKSQGRAFLYMIQDYEAGFYPWGLSHTLALETYDCPHIPIYNSAQLSEFFGQLRTRSVSTLGDLTFQPSVDRRYFYFNRESGQKVRKRLLFYARPTVAERNLYQIGLQALYKCNADGLFDNDWDIYFMGERIPDVILSSKKTIHCLPWMNFDTYASTLRSADIVLSLMLSPHPSYTPLEAAAAGAIVVTNSYASKTPESMQSISPNIICVSPFVADVEQALREAIRRSQDMEARERGSHVNLPPSWSEAFQDIPQKIASLVAAHP